ncbi:PleD family two-component system response regulator [Sphingomonas sp. NPDC079357]|uniref:PleD family two-component system response regulator n=1 Tax=Sphingomonas sp. NPDC079357 TaxID=3364518 RepID=UPI00384FF0D2
MTDMHHPVGETAERPLLLVVDDVFENRSSVQRRLSRMGYDCLCAESGQEALDLLVTTSPAVILLDYMMPVMSGLTVLKHLRASPRHAATPVVMLTARTDSEAVVASLTEGADDYVHKPIDFAVLKARIDVHIDRDRERRNLLGVNARMEDRVAARAIELGEVREMLNDQIARNQARDREGSTLVPDAESLETLSVALDWIVALSRAPVGSVPGDESEVLTLRQSLQSIWGYATHARKVMDALRQQSAAK